MAMITKREATVAERSLNGASPPARKAGKLGLGMATALVVGNMIGSGVFLLPASLAAFGGISLVAWVFTAAGRWRPSRSVVELVVVEGLEGGGADLDEGELLGAGAGSRPGCRGRRG